jgi:hypothetical protein
LKSPGNSTSLRRANFDISDADAAAAAPEYLLVLLSPTDDDDAAAAAFLDGDDDNDAAEPSCLRGGRGPTLLSSDRSRSDARSNVALSAEAADPDDVVERNVSITSDEAFRFMVSLLDMQIMYLLFTAVKLVGYLKGLIGQVCDVMKECMRGSR